MAELSLKQISERLNAKFTGDSRRLVFWYDEHGDFSEDIDSLQLENAQILKLDPKGQFALKYFLERQDTVHNYVIYAPFPKTETRKNHLEDMILYSGCFYADRISLLCADLGIQGALRPVIEKHNRFFSSQERTRQFRELGMEKFDADRILTGMMSVLCGLTTCSFEQIVREVLIHEPFFTEENEQDQQPVNSVMAGFERYHLIPDFWRLCSQYFGYTESSPTLEKLIMTFFATYAERHIHKEIPREWIPFISSRFGNINAFLESLMNHSLYQEFYDRLSKQAEAALHADTALKGYAPETLLDCGCFASVDILLYRWITGRLLAEDTGASLAGYTIPEICRKRAKMHFGGRYRIVYKMLENACCLVKTAHYQCPRDFPSLIRQYVEKDCLIDSSYRHFYSSYDRLDNTADFETLRDLAENIYTNEYLGKQLPQWNQCIMEPDAFSVVKLQRDFYGQYVGPAKERTVVIISDAMRYEVGRELFCQLQDDPKCHADLEFMLSTVPSYTRLGMSALLPHKELEITDDGKELVDGVYCIDLQSRQEVLQQREKDSCCMQFDAVKNMKKSDLRAVFTGKKVVYVYHDQIDVRGEHAEDEVFVACREAVSEIADLIRKLSVNANTLNFIVTADHGFIYKRDQFRESEKIGGMTDPARIVKRRYILSRNPVEEDGLCHLNLGTVLGSHDDKIVSFPCGVSVFKTPGSGGLNYVHGGSSPQEMLVPVVKAKMEKKHMDTVSAEIRLVSMVKKITNLVTSLDFMQSEAVNDTVKPAKYRICFESEKGMQISNEFLYLADSRETDVKKRIFHLQFTFKNQTYDRYKPYYLVIYDGNSGVEISRHEVVMDLAFAGDFGFE